MKHALSKIINYIEYLTRTNPYLKYILIVLLVLTAGTTIINLTNNKPFGLSAIITTLALAMLISLVVLFQVI